ncbi:unnamed protein product [Mycena citricolor]|uniref:Cytochrome P450 n=1 Tax=Mycena citricolor TaxID=2018698 RepID=A0AAD2HGW5_9AGAR|nr:unnamed protein product [Mycena citricolor]
MPQLHIEAWVLLALLTYLFVRIVKYTHILTAPRYFPRLISPFTPLGLPGALLPASSWTVAGTGFHWSSRFDLYKRGETIQLTPILGGETSIWTSNIDVAKQVAVGSHKTSYVKPPFGGLALLIWGMNLFSADGSLWRKHRRIVGPAFGNELYELVWESTSRIYEDMVESEGWIRNSGGFDVEDMHVLMTKLAFLVISTCGFGFQSDWLTPTETANETFLSVQQALEIVATDYMMLIFVPEFILNLPLPRFIKIRNARAMLMGFMLKQVAERKALIAAGVSNKDAFTLLVKANEEETGSRVLDDSELIGNVFLFLFAGHETTARSLTATLACIALDDEIQTEALDQILEVVGPDGKPEFEDCNKLDKVLALFYEATRMFPAAHLLLRQATEDNVLLVPKPVSEEGTIAVPIAKGTTFIVDMVGAQYNPRYFDEPEKFKPSRWHGLPPDSEQFTAFSVGSRACIGRKFATVEAICFLTRFIRDWKVAPLLAPGETREQWRKRVLDAKVLLALGIERLPLTLERRKLA